jgi:energy-coupling factor transporter ATP-binding protein EcfA2
VILRRLRVEHFRRYNLPVEICFDERFTVVAGLNEVGKSTLFDALRYALFRRSGGGGKDISRLEPWGTEGLTASVTVDFEYNGLEYQLNKCWGNKGGTRVDKRGTDGRFAPYKVEGADEFIAGMFAGQPQSKGAFAGFNGQNVGLAYLLFAPQGALPISGDRKEVELNPDARARLTQIVGDAAQTPDAARITKRVAEDFAACFTPTGKRKKNARADVASSELAAVEAEIVSFQSTIIQCTEIADQLEAAQHRAASATTEAKAAQIEIRQLRPRMQQAVLARAEYERAEAAFRDARVIYEDLISKAQRRESVERQLQQLQSSVVELEAAAGRGREAMATAVERRKVAGETLAIAPNDLALRKLETELEDATGARALYDRYVALLSRSTRAGELSTIYATAEAQYAGAGVGEKSDVTALQTLCERERELRVRLEAAETIVSIEALRELEVTWIQDDRAEVECVGATESADRNVDGNLTILLDGVARFTIRGPSGDAVALRCELADVVASLAGHETRLGTRSPLELQTRIDAKRQAHLERQRLGNELASVLNGSTAQELCDELQRLGPEAPKPPNNERPDQLRTAVKRERLRLETLRTASVEAIRLANDEEASAIEAATVSSARLRDYVDGTIRPLQAELAELARAGNGNVAREAELSEAYAKRYEAEQKKKAAIVNYESYALGDDPAGRLAELEHRVETLAEGATEAAFKVRELDSTLRRLSGQEPEAKLAELEEQRERLRSNLTEQECSEEAVRLLHQFAIEADARRVGSFAAPILALVKPWFADVTGRNLEALGLGLHSELNDLRVSGVSQAIDNGELSQGAGDQLALFIRLAFASLLTAEKCLGRMPMLLDDPLVNTDWQRRPRMLRVFEEVADSAQVVVFTCRPEDYAGTSARVVTLGDGDDRESGARPNAA